MGRVNVSSRSIKIAVDYNDESSNGKRWRGYVETRVSRRFTDNSLCGAEACWEKMPVFNIPMGGKSRMGTVGGFARTAVGALETVRIGSWGFRGECVISS